MTLSEFTSDWLKWLSDPYAVLGISVTADHQRILKRYRSIAKILHPDRYVSADPTTRELATQLLAKLVNPAYTQIKEEQGRKETCALLRLQAGQLLKSGSVCTAVARELSRQQVQAADIFYEQKISALAEQQFQPLAEFAHITQQLSELNLVYLQLKQGDGAIREKRSGLMPQPTQAIVNNKPASGLRGVLSQDYPQQDYAQRHYDRATQYVQNGSWKEAILELKDAIRIHPERSDYHALLGYIHFKQNSMGMARVYFKQALKLDPNNSLAKRFGAKIQMDASAPVPPASNPKETARRGLFGLFRK
ncbi:MAG: hypothetical protein B0A82_10925 [Alkalinema sp. CACIAM 70d]|nr:MAG: hypothetical protein B0A82_10925 [Alkalinema sp. CACIAM 70d]